MKDERATLRAQWLGHQLKELRNAAGLLQTDAGEHLQRSEPTISKYENGLRPIRRVDVLALLDLYGVHDSAKRDELVRLRDEAWRIGWWGEYESGLDQMLVDYIWLESRATLIRHYDPFAVPGLIQTERYARAIIEALSPGTEEQIDAWVRLRMERQNVVTASAVRLDHIIDESVILRRIGDREVMREQLHHLAELVADDRCGIRIVPFSTGLATKTFGQFSIFSLPDPYPDVAYTATLAGPAWLEMQDAERVLASYDQHSRVALSVDESLRMISRAAKDM